MTDLMILDAVWRGLMLGILIAILITMSSKGNHA